MLKNPRHIMTMGETCTRFVSPTRSRGGLLRQLDVHRDLDLARREETWRAGAWIDRPTRDERAPLLLHEEQEDESSEE
jgi:hypothetical protein